MSKSKKIFLVSLCVLFILSDSYAGDTLNYPDTVSSKRLNTVVYSAIGLYTATVGVLYLAWYKDTELTGFHWHNDNNTWLQIDKFGHATTAYTFSNYGFWWLRWAGVENNKAAIYGGLMGWTSMTVIEIFDGLSADYGASPGDLVANTFGALLFTGQQLWWKEQRIRLKFSYYPTKYAEYRPDLYGNNHLHRIIKDYNGQTLWMSFNIKSFLKSDSKFPGWLNFTVGYGVDGLLGPDSNPTHYQGDVLPHFERRRQYYVSFDVDWTRIPTNSKFLRFIFKGFSFVKAPMPTLEFTSGGGTKFYWLY